MTSLIGMPNNILVKSKKLPRGTRVGRLAVIGVPFYSGRKMSSVVCQCECGRIVCVRAGHLMAGRSLSCGCLNSEASSARRKTHGYAAKKHPVYSIWKGMIKRCYNSKCKSYKDYGGRGIIVCTKWRKAPGAFCNWAIANGWSSGLEIDRRDNDGPYSPNNCRFVPRRINARNKSSNRHLTAFGETKLLVEWSEDPRCLCPKKTFLGRIDDGWGVKEAMTTPIKRRPTGEE